MRYKTEPHIHVAEVSPCARLSAREMIRLYADAGYRTVFVSDHLHRNCFARFGEEPSREEIARGYEVLRRYGDRVDVVLTHKYEPGAASDEPLTLSALCAHIDAAVDFSHWYSGHWHDNIVFDDRHTAVYDTLIPLT